MLYLNVPQNVFLFAIFYIFWAQTCRSLLDFLIMETFCRLLTQGTTDVTHVSRVNKQGNEVQCSIKNTENSQFLYVLCEASASNNTLLLPKNTVRICKSVFNTLVLGSQTNDGPSKERQGTLVFSSTAPVAHLNRYRIISM